MKKCDQLDSSENPDTPHMYIHINITIQREAYYCKICRRSCSSEPNSAGLAATSSADAFIAAAVVAAAGVLRFPPPLLPEAFLPPSALGLLLETEYIVVGFPLTRGIDADSSFAVSFTDTVGFGDSSIVRFSSPWRCEST